MSLDDQTKCISSDLFFSTELNLWSLKSTYLKHCLSMSNNSLSLVKRLFSMQKSMNWKGQLPTEKMLMHCAKTYLCGESYPLHWQDWYFNPHIVSMKVLCQFNYCLINEV